MSHISKVLPTDTHISETVAPWITIRVAAEHFQCSPKTIRRWITQGRIEAQRFGPRLIRVNAASLDTLGRSLAYSA